MDETQKYIDSITNRTVTHKGATSAEVTHTGNNKTRFMSVRTVAADGTLLPTFVIEKACEGAKCKDISYNIVNDSTIIEFMFSLIKSSVKNIS